VHKAYSFRDLSTTVSHVSSMSSGSWSFSWKMAIPSSQLTAIPPAVVLCLSLWHIVSGREW